MSRLRICLLLALLGLSGCLGLPRSDDTAKKTPLAPLAAPPPITARFVNRNNAHEISQALCDEIENDLHGPPNRPAAPTQKNSK